MKLLIYGGDASTNLNNLIAHLNLVMPFDLILIGHSLSSLSFYKNVFHTLSIAKNIDDGLPFLHLDYVIFCILKHFHIVGFRCREMFDFE